MSKLLDIGQLPPQALDYEEVVLGAIMLERDAFPKVKSFLTPECFYKTDHQTIFRAIQEIDKRRDPIDILSITKQLHATKQLEQVGGAYIITQYTNRVASSANVEEHARVIYQMYLKREIIAHATQSIIEAYDQTSDVLTLLSNTSKGFRNIENKINDEKDSDSIDTVIDNTFIAMEYAKNHKGVLGYKTLLNNLDEILCGLQPSTVYVVAARPGMGKSALIKTIFVNLARQRIKCKVFSMEVTAEKFMMNIFSDLLETNNRRIFSGEIREDEKAKLIREITELKSYMEIDDRSAITIQYLERKVKQAVANGCKVIIIDYLQLMTVLKSDVDPTNRERQISFLTGNIKRLANEYKIPIIEVSQLSRKVEERADKKPILADLRESGAIEQDAEAIIFVYRPEYYGFFTDKANNDMRGMAELIVAKNRNGEVNRAVQRYIAQYTKFDNISSFTESIEETQIQIFTKENTPGEEPAF